LGVALLCEREGRDVEGGGCRMKGLGGLDS
jgi:hypothetical protein